MRDRIDLVLRQQLVRVRERLNRVAGAWPAKRSHVAERNRGKPGHVIATVKKVVCGEESKQTAVSSRQITNSKLPGLNFKQFGAHSEG